MIKKLLRKPILFLFFVFSISVVCPITGGVLHKVSCPAPVGLAYFPGVSARCVGELLGDIGIFFLGLPGLALSFILVFDLIYC